MRRGLAILTVLERAGVNLARHSITASRTAEGHPRGYSRMFAEVPHAYLKNQYLQDTFLFR